jgi:signal peptidase II
MNSPQTTGSINRLNHCSVFRFLVHHRFDYLFLFTIGAIIIGLDQWTKALVRANIPLGADWLPTGMAWLLPFARVRYWYNSGAAFGIFQNGNLVFTILAILVILLIILYFPRTEEKDWWLRTALAMQFAGASGNLIDRLAFAHVTDFISVGSFAIFNVADASISVGVVVLLLGVWLNERTEKKKTAITDSQKIEILGTNRDEEKSV